jgi:hypothetical protein
MVDWRLDDLGHFVGLGTELERARDMGHRGIDTEVARRDVEGRQAPEDPDGPEVEAQFLGGLAQGRGLDGLTGVLLPSGKGDLAAVVEDALGAPGQEDPETAVLGVEEDEDAGLAAGVFDLEVGLVARTRLGDHGELGGDAGERGPEALLDAAEELQGIHGGRLLPAPAGQELLDLVDLLGYALGQDLAAGLGDEDGVLDADAEPSG